MAGSDVKAITRTATGAFFAGPARIRGVYIKTNASGNPAFIIKDGASGDTVLENTVNNRPNRLNIRSRWRYKMFN